MLRSPMTKISHNEGTRYSVITKQILAFVAGAILSAFINQMFIFPFYSHNDQQTATINFDQPSRYPAAITISNEKIITPIPISNGSSLAYTKYIATKDTKTALDSDQGNNGGEWTWCTHLIQYGPNFDRGFANFISGILRPESALEFGCGIGLYINYVEHFSTAQNKDSSRFIGIEPESMINAGVFGVEPWKATQLAMSIFEVEQSVLDSMGTFDVVFSSEVAEHIPAKFHDQMFDFLVKKTNKFLVFGAARASQGGTGHLRESMKPMEFWINKFKEKGMIHSDRLSNRVREHAYNAWDKARNTFVMVKKEYFEKINDKDGLGGLKDVSDLFPKFHQKYVDIKEDGTCKR